MNKPKKIKYYSDSVLDSISKVDRQELNLELENIKNAVLGMTKQEQKYYKFLLK